MAGWWVGGLMVACVHGIDGGGGGDDNDDYGVFDGWKEGGRQVMTRRNCPPGTAPSIPTLERRWKRMVPSLF